MFKECFEQQQQAIILSNLMSSTGWDIEAMEKLGIPSSDRQKMGSLMEELDR